MLLEYVKALFLIFVAELGDKSQILAMVFATKYKIRYVLFGVFMGAALNHGLAVILGTYLSDMIPLELLSLLAGILFVFFGLWSLKLEDEDEEEIKEGKLKLGPIFTVGLAFFIGELGDKTQLATITLSTQTSYPFILWMGTVSGMTLTGAIGIWIGTKLGDKIPELVLKIVSAIVFIFFGSLKLVDTLPSQYTTMPILTAYFALVGLISYYLIRKNIQAEKESAYKKAARDLYVYNQEIKKAVDDICIGCDFCLKDSCLIGHAKELLQYAMEEGQIKNVKGNKKSYQMKNFDKQKVMEGLVLTIQCIKDYNQMYGKEFIMHDVRRALEMILIEKSLSYNNLDEYLKDIDKYDKEIALELRGKL